MGHWGLIYVTKVETIIWHYFHSDAVILIHHKIHIQLPIGFLYFIFSFCSSFSQSNKINETFTSQTYEWMMISILKSYKMHEGCCCCCHCYCRITDEEGRCVHGWIILSKPPQQASGESHQTPNNATTTTTNSNKTVTAERVGVSSETFAATET